MTERAIDAAIRNLASPSAAATCLVLAHPEIARLEAEERTLLARYGWPRTVPNRELAAALRYVPEGERPNRARAWLEQKSAMHAPGPLLCSGTDLLFEPSLKLEPPGLLIACARRTRLVVLWPGTWDGDVLTYAVPEHAHSRRWRRPGAVVVGLH